MKNFLKIIIVLLLIAASGVAGYFLGIWREGSALSEKLDIIRPIREHNASYKFIDPLLAYLIPQSEQKKLTSLKNKIKYFILQNKNTGLSDASVFFYDLNRGRWIGVDETNKYDPASLFKVIIMVSYLKEAEKNPNLFKEYFVYTSDIDSVVKKDTFNVSSSLEIGKSYSAEELINKMIIDSDNGAQFLLLKNIDAGSLDYIYNVLNIKTPDAAKDDFTISPRTYSLFFRILYSATYLNASNSEKALEVLSKTTFNDGIVAGVPKDTLVAHKFGEHIISKSNNVEQIELHDCGIIYYPNYPYFLCVMTKGSNLDELKDTIKNISSLIYEDYKGL